MISRDLAKDAVPPLQLQQYTLTTNLCFRDDMTEYDRQPTHDTVPEPPCPRRPECVLHPGETESPRQIAEQHWSVRVDPRSEPGPKLRHRMAYPIGERSATQLRGSVPDDRGPTHQQAHFSPRLMQQGGSLKRRLSA